MRTCAHAQKRTVNLCACKARGKFKLFFSPPLFVLKFEGEKIIISRPIRCFVTVVENETLGPDGYCGDNDSPRGGPLGDYV